MERGVHYLALANIRQRLEANTEEYALASVQLAEALKMGDLRENSEYDSAKDSMARIVATRDMLTPMLSMPVVKANDSANIIEEGCVLDLQVFRAVPEPIAPGSEEFTARTQDVEPAFSGRVMFGGTLPIQELLADAALSADTFVGKFLLGKRPGSYCVKVPGGFVPLIVKKLKSTEFDHQDLGCVYHG